ncbi:MAG: ABC transporter ATP-binding protein, partial [Candidatus Lokiarchaeota archaeon]|nr:ABC transporter ATP-binding protein [Candidatus Lokiarchaeota archaeon]
MVQPAVEVNDLVKVFKGGTRALNGLTISVDAGNIFALLGPNGSGKTTLMRILTTQIKATSGSAVMFGLDVAREGKRVRHLISYVPQEMSVWTDISGYENMVIYSKLYGLDGAKRAAIIEEALKGMELTDSAHRLVKTYSGGMIRRLEIASALLIRPRLLFLDEPTIGLDPSARKHVWEKVLSFQKEYGTTVFFNTHYMDEADMYSDQIAIINRGKEVVKGKAGALKESVGNERIHVDVGDSAIDEGAVARLKGIPGVSGVVRHDGEVDILAQDADKALPGVMDLLRGMSVKIRKISTSKPTLDDVFLKYAGTSME